MVSLFLLCNQLSNSYRSSVAMLNGTMEKSRSVGSIFKSLAGRAITNLGKHWYVRFRLRGEAFAVSLGQEECCRALCMDNECMCRVLWNAETTRRVLLHLPLHLGVANLLKTKLVSL